MEPQGWEEYTLQTANGPLTKRLPYGVSDADVRKAFEGQYTSGEVQRPELGANRYQRPAVGQQRANPWQLKNADLTLGQKLEQGLADLMGGDRDAHRRARKYFRFINDATPVGSATGMDEGGDMFRNGLRRGQLGQAALGAGIFALSASPIPGAVRRPIKGMFGNKVRQMIANEDGAIRAWHGSPHDFDRFDMSKIGTGEGAQAYGHGLYFAENPEVAREYRDVLADQFKRQGGGFVSPTSNSYVVGGREISSGNPDYVAAKLLAEADGFGVGDDWIKREIGLRGLDSYGDETWRAVQRLKGQPVETRKHHGRLYEVNINAEPEDFLDWDAPLSGQGANLPGPYGRAIRDAGPDAADIPEFQKRTGVALSQMFTLDPKGAASKLRQRGYPGVRYFDEGSRGAGDGTRNYVVFDDSLIDILNKY